MYIEGGPGAEADHADETGGFRIPLRQTAN
jgi:hypothetical protein